MSVKVPVLEEVEKTPLSEEEKKELFEAARNGNDSKIDQLFQSKIIDLRNLIETYANIVSNRKSLSPSFDFMMTRHYQCSFFSLFLLLP